MVHGQRGLRRRAIGIAAAALLTCALPLGASAQEYPSRPVKIVVPLPAGQGSDITARIVADELSRIMGQPFVVENRVGAGGTIGAAYVAKALPDGYTLLLATSTTHSIAPVLLKNVPYDPIKDFAPVGNLVLVEQVLVTSSRSGFTDARDFISKAKAKPMNYASSGSGTTSHLTMEILRDKATLPTLQHIPFKGSAEAQTQVIGGEVQAMFDALPGVLGNIKGGKLKALGIASMARSPLLPDVPTLSEQGLTNFTASGWGGLMAPAGTPPAVLDKLNAAVRKALQTPELRNKMLAMAQEPAPGTREEFAAFIKGDVDKWGDAVRKSGATVD